jgi:hypothetical protein
VAKKGANRPIFEGNMPPKKMYPPYWRRYRRHNRNPVKGAFLPQKLDPKGIIEIYSESLFKRTYLFVYLIEAKVALYVSNGYLLKTTVESKSARATLIFSIFSEIGCLCAVH